MPGGVLQRRVLETPIAVLDCETTGLHPGADRIVEIAVVRKDPGQAAHLVLNTLVNPHRPVGATEIHGITDEDVRDAPDFVGIAAEVARALGDCVLTAYNVYFDMRFLDDELERAGIRQELPHVCLMYMRPMLGLGPRRPLKDACAEHGIPHDHLHFASADALASAQLMEIYLLVLQQKGVLTFEQLAALKSYKFLSSLRSEPLSPASVPSPRAAATLKPRRPAVGVAPTPSENKRLAMAGYWDALGAALADLDISDEEVRFLERKKVDLGLAIEQVRMLHARAFAAAISNFTDDQWLDESECEKLRRLHHCLSRLGWAPGL